MPVSRLQPSCRQAACRPAAEASGPPYYTFGPAAAAALFRAPRSFAAEGDKASFMIENTSRTGASPSTLKFVIDIDPEHLRLTLDGIDIPGDFERARGGHAVDLIGDVRNGC